MQKRKKIIKSIIISIIIILLNKSSIFAQTSLYPTSADYKVENGFDIITKTYTLSPDEDPSLIPKETFTQYDEDFVFSEIIKKELSEDDVIEHVEPITITTSTNDLNTILSNLDTELEYEKDGYIGTLKLDISSINTKVSGYSNNSYTATRTREYPNLSTQDTSLVPKTITDGGMTYTLKDVNFRTGNTNNIDSTEIATSYTAVANYTCYVSSKSVSGYETTANYVGNISKNVTDKIIYTATFIGNPINNIEPTEIEETKEIENSTLHNRFNLVSFIPLLKTLLFLTIISAISLLIYYFLFYRNITIFNQNDLEYIKIGKLHLNKKNPKLVINLNNIPISKVKSGNFVIELSSNTVKFLKNKNLYVIFKEFQNVHLIKDDITGNKYQFESNFHDVDLNYLQTEENEYQEV